MEKNARIYVAGHTGLAGAALVRALEHHGFRNLILRTRSQTDLTQREQVFAFFRESSPEYVFIAAGRVGGIAANMAAPVEFLTDNLKIQNNLLEACLEHRVTKTLFLASSCIYPRECPQPMREAYLMTGPLEPTNASYALAKLAGVHLGQALRAQYGLNVISAVPCNLYGPGDHFEIQRSHVVSALVRRFSEAAEAGSSSVTLWGTGSARRELLHVNDMADACLFLMDRYDAPEPINMGTGIDHTIRELAESVAREVGYRGDLTWDLSKPDGMPRKVLDVTSLHGLGWKHRIDLAAGLRSVIADYRSRFPTTPRPRQAAV